MSRIAYVNGRYLPHKNASVHIEDRGYQFADGIYEVCEIHNSQIIDMGPHLDRLDRSLRELRINAPMQRAALIRILKEVITLNRVTNGLVYIQITRGVAPRDHYFPKSTTPSSLVVTAKHVNRKKWLEKGEQGIKVITTPENRWERVDIKSVSLLPNVLAKQKAKEAGANEAWFVDKDGFVTEGGSTNAWIVLNDGRLVTRPAEAGILRGITRAGVMKLAAKKAITVEERPFTVDEAKHAREAFCSSASGLVMPVTHIDDTIIGAGAPGELTQELRKTFHEASELTKL
ncbi:D-amino-acid transaminase [Polycladidibacter stylochi]|uniref:D-amino-acid transaminase n=1 Tax=Polycladidibacter stylochi TaxID=1807766 RepID=UPI00082FC3E3|nr:D-amino-acid transaminase [Pseudovibrio stylochi]